MKEILKVNNLIKKFPKAGGEIDDADAISVLKGINFDVEQGEYVGIMGKSGCGKTTLLKILGFMDQQTDGDVIFDGVNTNELWKEVQPPPPQPVDFPHFPHFRPAFSSTPLCMSLTLSPH